VQLPKREPGRRGIHPKVSTGFQKKRFRGEEMHHERKVRDLELREDLTVAQMVKEFGGLSFNARKLARASDIWVEALESGARVYFSLAGAITPAGLRRVIAKAMERKIVHLVVTTGANMVHDMLQAWYQAHEIGSEFASDEELKSKKVMRIFDTYLSNEQWDKLDNWLEKEFYPTFLDGISSDIAIIKPTEFFRKLGERLHGDNDRGVLATAYSMKVPIYCPAYTDSDFGIALNDANIKLMKEMNKKVIVDPISDFGELVQDVDGAEKRAVVIVGGGAPKNYVLQSGISLKQEKDFGFDYGIQLTTDTPFWGGLSGATLREAISWGKMRSEKSVTVYSDATITLPLLIESVLDRYGK
jgi:deoxyhypusine synthase